MGSIAGFFGGWVDNIIMRFLDIYQSVPMMVMAIALSSSLGAGMRSAVIAIGISTLPIYARLIRGSLLEIRGMEYIEAAVSVNASKSRILLRHMIPNAISPVIVTLTMSVGPERPGGGLAEFHWPWRAAAAAGVGRHAFGGTGLHEGLSAARDTARGADNDTGALIQHVRRRPAGCAGPAPELRCAA